MRVNRLPRVFYVLAGTLATAVFVAVATAWAQDPTGEDSQTPTLPETEVIAPQRPQQVTTNDDTPPSILEGTIFSSPEAFGYSADSSTSGTIIDVPNLELPATVDVVTEQVIEDQQAIRFDDVIRDIPGAIKVNDQLRPDSVFIRGFEIRSRDMRKNGFRDPTFSPRDLANVQRIEVLKGPSSVVWGAGQPAGMINFITKKPLPYLYDDLRAQFGSYGLQRYTVDSTGPVDPEATTLYRFVAAFEDRSSFRDFGFNETLLHRAVGDLGARRYFEAHLGRRVSARPAAIRYGCCGRRWQSEGAAVQPAFWASRPTIFKSLMTSAVHFSMTKKSTNAGHSALAHIRCFTRLPVPARSPLSSSRRLR